MQIVLTHQQAAGDFDNDGIEDVFILWSVIKNAGIREHHKDMMIQGTQVSFWIV